MFREYFFLLLMFIYCGLLTDLIKSQTLEVVTDNELLDLCRSENQVVVLFSMYLIAIFFKLIFLL